ncbi:hypothetical protein ACYULU_08160 [Breznakiellaceae bacterium SP9]
MPLALRNFFYNGGNYFSILPSSFFVSKTTVDNYAALYFLQNVTNITDSETNFCTMLVNNLTHEPAFFQAPDYVPVSVVTDKGTGAFANEDHYHVNMAAFLLLGKFFDFLKENGVYDNTRIIIVSDHGRDIKSPFPNNITLPNAEGVEFYNALLLVKDFDSDFHADSSLLSDNTFMTNADVPLLAAQGIIENAVNPFTGKTLMAQKDKGVTITTSNLWMHEKHKKYSFDIKKNEWLYVNKNIFEESNWKNVEITE